MTIFRLKQFASTSAHAAVGAMRWNYDRAELIADGVVHGIGVFGGLVAATVLIVLIAATYTPFIMELKDSIFAVALLIGVWCVAIVGIVLKLVLPGRFDRLSVGLFLAMGWSGFMLYDAVVAALPSMALWFVVAGGALYSLGVIFYPWQRLRFQNVIWHSFVLLGAACHYTAVLDLVLT